MAEPTLKQIGTARTAYKSRSECPRQGTDECPEAEIHIAPEYARALHRVYPGQEIMVVTWLDRADRETLQCRPGGDPDLPVHGIFCTRSPNRPNPLGLHPCTVTSIQGNTLTVARLEVLDETPVLDIKPDIRPRLGSRNLDLNFPQHLSSELISWGRRLWERGLLSGFNGNLSIRLEDRMLITRSQAVKGALIPADLAVLDIEMGSVLAGEAPSSEAGMHLEIYRNQPRAGAVVHTHPPHILALNISGRHQEIAGMPVFESGTFASIMGNVAAGEPGSLGLARECGEKSNQKKCLILERHGLTCWGKDIKEACALSEELDALAQIALESDYEPYSA
ncbi:MAG: tRNA (N6-threonylcarbamoyladenosine(37)-N6)-methyltransferase TrmO [Desulfonatronovibrionaceae bacterium]